MRQAVFLLIGVVNASLHLTTIPPLLWTAGRDAWMCIILALVPGLGTVWLTVWLGLRHRGQTLVQYASSLLGPALGRLAGLFYGLTFLFLTALTLGEFGQVMKMNYLTRTPVPVHVIGLVLLVTLGVRLGLEPLGRTADVLVPIMIGVGALVAGMVAPFIRIGHLFPLLEAGIGPVLRGTAVVWSDYAQLTVLALFLPQVDRPRRMYRAGLLLLVILVMMGLGPTSGTITVFGIETGAALPFPSVKLARQVELIRGVEAGLILLWVGGTFLRTSVFLYGSCLAWSQTLRLRDWRLLLLPLAAAAAAAAPFITADFPALLRYQAGAHVMYMTAAGTGVPLLLGAVSLVRGARRRRDPPGAGRSGVDDGARRLRVQPRGALRNRKGRDS